MRWCIIKLDKTIRYLFIAIISMVFIIIPPLFLDPIWVGLVVTIGISITIIIGSCPYLDDTVPPTLITEPNIDPVTKLAMLQTDIKNAVNVYEQHYSPYTFEHTQETIDDIIDNSYHLIYPATYNFKDEKDVEEIKRSDVIEFEEE